MSKPYVPKEPGDIIRSQDWNDMQAQGRAHVESHAHTGAPGQGVKLTGEAIAEDAALSVRAISVNETLSVRGRDLAGEIDKLNAKWSSGSEEFVVGGGLRVPDADILLRGPGSRDDGLGYYGERRAFASRNIDGPALFGRSGGVLGTRQADSERAALAWNDQGGVEIPGRLRVGAQEPWIPLPLANGWVNHGGGWADAAFMKDSLGFVHLRGLVKNGPYNDAIGYLPEQFRPEFDVILSAAMAFSPPIGMDIVHRVDVRSDGALIFRHRGVIAASDSERVTIENAERLFQFPIGNRPLDVFPRKISNPYYLSLDSIRFLAHH